MADDFFGGMFDFNGDGKTDLGEQFLAYQIFREVTKDEENTDDAFDENDDPDDDPDRSDDPDDLDSDDVYSYVPPRGSFHSDSTYSHVPPHRYPPEPPAEPEKKVLFSREIPEEMPLAAYRNHRSVCWWTCILLIPIAAVLCLIPGAFLWAACETLEPGSSASMLVCGVIGLIAFIVILLIICATGRAIAAELRDLQKAKEAYRRYAAKENPRTPDRGGSLSGIPKN